MSKPKMIGPYEVVKSIGRGSFGIVTAVKDENEKMYDKINNMDIKCVYPDPLPDSFSKDLINLCYWMLKKDWKDRPTIYDIISTDYIQDELQLFKREMLQERNSQI
ncbi:hypothetical protein C923_01252 [Plasmodium falciparum UGT5.1]|uniref:non-specific serine/threonine protein kinase n=1 Tax=Plasmodium falciparum UGT5.1 TaxID=1237627 RepID=W7JSQ4_PLAFA|nr:hypothetical protein C923_01252 [Plasmodium falciparum UGT5.1]